VKRIIFKLIPQQVVETEEQGVEMFNIVLSCYSLSGIVLIPISQFSPPINCEVGIMLPIIQMEKSRLGEVKSLSQGSPGF